MDIYFVLNGDQFVWNDEKASRNWHKHGVCFNEAVAVFEDFWLMLLVMMSHAMRRLGLMQVGDCCMSYILSLRSRSSE